VREKSLYSLGDNQFRLGRRDEARDTWMRQVTEFPNGVQSRPAYFRLGTAAFSKGDIKTAGVYYRKTLENSADEELTIKAKFALAGCYEAEDALADALALYREIEHRYANPEAIQIKIRALETRIIKKSY
jgi:TolA-binding protein